MKNLRSIVAVVLLPICTTTFTWGVVESSSAAAVSVLQSLDYRYFVAGGTCAAISHGITTPIDVVKTKKQSDPAKYGKMGLIGTAMDIARTDGSDALLGGLGPTVVGYGIEGAMKFGVYEITKPMFRALFSHGNDPRASTNPALAYLCASVVAGAVAAALLCPMESTRIRMVTDPAYANKGLFTALPQMIREDGPFASFSLGLWAMLAKQVPYTLGKQVSFDVFAGLLYAFFHAIPTAVGTTTTTTTTTTGIVPFLSETQIKWVVSVLAAFMASIIACIFSQPGDMILTETYKKKQQPTKLQGLRNRVSTTTTTTKNLVLTDRSFLNVVRTIYGREGLVSFFTGTGARIVHVGLIITSQLVIYDLVKQLLGLPATGSH
jgi:solute carrier family 25 (mitochondrial phosphate transporter), member 3